MAQDTSQFPEATGGVDVWLDEKTYRSFAVFDGLIRTGSWRRPAWFAGVFTALAAVSFAVAALRQQGWLLGAVLLLVGLGLPASYFGRFFGSVNQRVRRLRLDKGSRRAYCLSLEEQPGSLLVTAPPAAPLTFSLQEAFGAWLRKDAIYLYVQEEKVYILPETCAPEGLGPLWARLHALMPADRLHG